MTLGGGGGMGHMPRYRRQQASNEINPRTIAAGISTIISNRGRPSFGDGRGAIERARCRSLTALITDQTRAFRAAISIGSRHALKETRFTAAGRRDSSCVCVLYVGASSFHRRHAYTRARHNGTYDVMNVTSACVAGQGRLRSYRTYRRAS